MAWQARGLSHMPVEYAGFMLKPNNFFSANPAMALPEVQNGHSVWHGEPVTSCCGR
jgi:primary-amine oxidase